MTRVVTGSGTWLGLRGIVPLWKSMYLYLTLVPIECSLVIHGKRARLRALDKVQDVVVKVALGVGRPTGCLNIAAVLVVVIE